MSDFVLKANDRLPAIKATLNVQGTPVPLDTATKVDFIMRSKGANQSEPKVNAAAVIVDPTGGIVRYDWAVGDTSTPGSYEAEWEVTWSDGKTQTFPTKTYHTIDILADLDSAA